MVKEIITLQFGNYANYVGTHYWNLRTHERNAQNLKEQQTNENQDSLFFREGRDASNRTIYTPRLLIFDLKENIGSFDGSDAYTEQYTSKNERNDKPSDWEGELEIYDQARDTPSTFLNEQRDRRFKGKQARAGGYKGDSIKTWADFNTTTLHSKTLHSISGVDCGTSLGEMNTFNEGTEVYDGREKTPNSRFYSSSLHSIVADNFSFPLELNKNTSLGGLLTDATLFGRTPVFSGFLGIDSRQNLDIQFQNNTHTGGGYDDPRISSSRKRTNAAINSNHGIGDQPLPLIDFSGTSKDSTFGLDWDNVKPVKYGTENSKNDTLSNGFSVCRGLSLPSLTSTGGTVFSSSSSFEIPLGFPSDYSDCK
ncbi:Protein misato [Zancudomyces culisetae]|uniref:Protein misato n=1 Tax=Zancudomyces culisetae TaxID=1213189 RepID=A0A1R1PMI6_ZANCU|nr:Protein misato [Zancudomyces culisetae]|eukprot:OMH82156.1 Protein misato [Zancudomyces culisetae]